MRITEEICGECGETQKDIGKGRANLLCVRR